MDIYEFHQSGKTYTIAQLKADVELSKDIQTCLIWLELLDPPVDGIFGPLSTAALKTFQEYLKCPKIGVLDTDTAKKLIETDPVKLREILEKSFGPLKLGNDSASRIIKYMLLKKYHVSVKPKEYNIVYVEGMNADGRENPDVTNHFNDCRIVIEIVNGVPTIRGNWEATTEPGMPWIKNPMNPKGAASIKFGQYKAWRVGPHKNQNPALRQVTSITVHRDYNRDGSRVGDSLDTGVFGINQHHANNAPRHDVGSWSAGCLVGRTKASHEEFMKIIMGDNRYKKNKHYTFETTIIPGDDLQDKFPFS